jgi:general secretion pathway protein K
MRFIYNKGVALITVMLIVALCAVLASQMTGRLILQLQRTTNLVFNQQAYWYAMGAEAFAKRVLHSSFKKDKKITHLGQQWAAGKTSYPVDFGDITGEITDLQSCLNLNALRPATSKKKASSGASSASLAQNAFKELVMALNIEGVSQFDAEYMTDALTDWLDEDSSIVSAGGAEDNDYAAKEFPYLPANNYIASINELRVVEHFTPAIIGALKGYICVIPNSNLHQINVNTLDSKKPELLQALLGLSHNDAQQVLSNRDEKGFKDNNEFFSLAELKSLSLTEQQKSQFVVDSDYFILKTSASFNDSYFALKTIFKISNNDQAIVIARTIGREY